ncbi:MAG TPA: glucose 1-dehydrogenase [Devosia sp.]|jgi:NAD(P)-dependent dehydrogenase (short-subunit alcohol dehydrogenase family)|nr:glucose 1-dehydrogenase [Devosia sp.]
MLDIDLKGRRALVTGGNSGIGAAIVASLAEAGADVAINFVTHPETADAGADAVRKAGGRALALAADVSNAEAVAAMFKRLDAEWGGLDILVNNAGIDGKSMPGASADLDEWRRVIDINLCGAFYCAREALSRMQKQRRGVILNMSSVHEVIPWSGYSAYAASKAGLSMLSRTLAQEAAPFNVRVLALAPGAIKTAINQAVWSDPAGLADLNAKIPLGRMGETQEIARMATVLVSDIASYATGTTLFVDGGMTDYADFSHGG